jgi:nitrite reductase/ring-hydroxylating ferredoxin subunit
MHFLCSSVELGEAQSRGFDIDGLKILAIRRGGQVFIYRNRCPHRGVALEWQPDRFLDASASLIQCATHGALFLVETGECIAGPCAGDMLTALDCHEDDQGIWLSASALE